MSNNNNLEEGLELMLNFDKMGGLVPVAVQNALDGRILLQAFVNREAFDSTVRNGYATFYSRSQGKIWRKGETSGDLLRIVKILVDCDQDALVYVVLPEGKGVCHTKTQSGEPRKSCFYRELIILPEWSINNKLYKLD